MNTIEVKKSLAEIKTTIDDLNCQIAVLNQQIYELEPEKTYIDVILEQKYEISYEEIAKDYGFKPTELISNLIDECGWGCVNFFCDKKYRLEIYYALKAKGILPLIERGAKDES